MDAGFMIYEAPKNFIRNSDKVLQRTLFKYAELSDREVNIMHDRFVDHKTQKEVAIKLGLTPSRVSQLEHIALSKLYHTLKTCDAMIGLSGLRSDKNTKSQDMYMISKREIKRVNMISKGGLNGHF